MIKIKYIIIVLIVGLSLNLKAATYYIGPKGSDNRTGTSESQAWATFSHAISQMNAGDVLIILDGTYYQSLSISKSGTSTSPITIKAKNDGEVIIDGQNSMIPVSVSGNYIVIEGIVAKKSSAYVWSITGDHNIIRRCSSYDGNYNINTGHGICVLNASYNLIVDCIAAGISRHVVMVYGPSSTGNVVRRTFTKWASHNDEGRAICNYGAHHTTIENSIVWESASPTDGGICINANYERTAGGYNVKVLGSIIMNGRSSNSCGLTITYPPAENSYIENCLIYNYRYGVLISNDPPPNFTIKNCTIMNCSDGVINNRSSGGVIKNTIVYNNDRGWPGSQLGSISYSCSYGNTSNNEPPNWDNASCMTVDPQLYGLSIPANSPCKGAGENGEDIGANIYYRYENGVLTDEPLWPWPMQDRIKKELGIDVMVELEQLFGPLINDDNLRVNINASPLSDQIPITVNFTGEATGGTPPYTYSWDFGDGNMSIEQNPNHTYNSYGNYTAVLTVTDNQGEKAANSVAINLIDPNHTLSINNVKLTNVGQIQALTQIQKDTWYDLYVYFTTPNGWEEVSYADIWLNSSSYTEGTIANRGGTHYSTKSYIISFSIASEGLWVKETEGTSEWSNITGIMGRYIDDDNNEYQLSSSEGWAKARMKLLGNSETGIWSINAYVRSRDGVNSTLYKKDIVVIQRDITPPSRPRNVRAEFLP
ncbi:MAG: PKD domain-containing protein [Candidatus Hodarchaeota archaeon]